MPFLGKVLVVDDDQNVLEKEQLLISVFHPILQNSQPSG